MRNLIPRGGRSLHLVGGAFGKRWTKISGACGRSPEAMEVPLGANEWLAFLVLLCLVFFTLISSSCSDAPQTTPTTGK